MDSWGLGGKGRWLGEAPHLDKAAAAPLDDHGSLGPIRWAAIPSAIMTDSYVTGAGRFRDHIHSAFGFHRCRIELLVYSPTCRIHSPPSSAHSHSIILVSRPKWCQSSWPHLFVSQPVTNPLANAVGITSKTRICSFVVQVTTTSCLGCWNISLHGPSTPSLSPQHS